MKIVIGELREKEELELFAKTVVSTNTGIPIITCHSSNKEINEMFYNINKIIRGDI